MTRLILFLLVLSASACSKSDPQPTPSPKVDSDSLSIALGSCVIQSSSNIEFCVEKIEDSRCPCNTTCIWEGVCAVSITAKGNGQKDSTFILYTEVNNPPSEMPTSIQIQGKKVHLLSSAPENLCADQGNYPKYSNVLFVE